MVSDEDYYNSEGYDIALAPTDILKVMILKRRDAVISAIEEYYNRISAGSRAPKHNIISKTRSLFIEVSAAMKRSDKKLYTDLRAIFMGDNVKDIILAFDSLNEWLDKKSITRVDIQRKIDTTIAEKENVFKGLD